MVHPFVAYPRDDDFNVFLHRIFSSKSYKYDNYDKTAYKFSSYC